jgi:beta-galactosidase/beta-glucuronidase
MASPTTACPRPEYPRPQFVRPNRLNLNGTWQFEFDRGDSGEKRGVHQRELEQTITVPFCPESVLSGIGDEDFHNAVWYRREVTIPSDAAWDGQRVLLHFQAVDYDATVWVDGREVRRHRGGFSSFTCDCGVVTAGQKLTVVVRARDDHRAMQPKGKQSGRYERYSCHYTRTTGVWQTVWIEPVSPRAHLLRTRVTPDVAGSRFSLVQPLRGDRRGLRICATLRDEAGIVATHEVAADADLSPQLSLDIPADRVRLWGPADPHLYDLRIELLDDTGGVIDAFDSYAGLRSVTIDGLAVRINGETIFQRLVLDQGYYPDGILTAPSDEALKRDIELGLEAGFNGARLHQKVFEERFLYWADKLGYLVWGEFADWGCNKSGPAGENQQPTASYITQWLEVVERDQAHPSIIGWCPLNETWQNLSDKITELDDVTRGMFLATRAMDPTRPVLDTSGYSHRVHETDIYDSHDYDQNVESFRERHAGLAQGNAYVNLHHKDPISLPYAGQPYFVSEFGGIWWNPDAKPGEDSWGYGNRPTSIEEFYTRFEGLCGVLLDNPAMFGYCYTQLTDVYQEQNGIYTFDRRPKFDMRRIRAAQQRPAAIEREARSSALAATA